MLANMSWVVLVLALILPEVDPSHGTLLGAVVHIVPIESHGGERVRAHFMVAAPNPCPELTGVCTEGEEDCVVHPTTTPFTGTMPAPGWCIRRWQKTIPSNYNATVELGSHVTWDVFIRAEARVRANTGQLNRPPYVALPPPLRARVGCPRRIHLALLDPDKDAVRCRFARADQGECHGCARHSFIELNEENCMLSFSGEASAGWYSVMLMVEDILTLSSNEEPKPLSSIPAFLSLTVEEASSSGCSAEPVATGQTPQTNTKLIVAPYEQVDVTATFTSELESVEEIGVVGPPALFRSSLITTGSMTSKGVTWVRAPNTLPPILPICFSANTNSSQSEPRCLWIYQREMKTLPPGTRLECSSTEMRLVLPVATLKNIVLEDIQLNSPTCPISYNSTHLTAHIPLTGCGTKKVHVGSELIYTNTLKSVQRNTTIRRLPSLTLPLACHISAVKAKAQYTSITASEEEIFGSIVFWLEIAQPGSDSFSSITRNATFRHLRSLSLPREAREAVVLLEPRNRGVWQQVEMIDLRVMSNSKKTQVELMVDNCMESVTEDFSDTEPLVEEGCKGSSNIMEVLTPDKSFKTYRLNISGMGIHGASMFVECKVHLCIPTRPSDKCPDPCLPSTNTSTLAEWLSTTIYTIRSGAINILRESITANPKPPAAAATNLSEGMAAGVATANAPTVTTFITEAVFITMNLCLQLLLTIQEV